MANVFVEARPKGRPEGSPIADFVAESHADEVLATFRTQHEAIDWRESRGTPPLVARVRHLNDKKSLARRLTGFLGQASNRQPVDGTAGT
jgi:hypothetical protein